MPVNTKRHREAHLPGRERARLRIAREDGFLNAACPDPRKLLNTFGFWCWRLRIPIVWYERLSAHSRYGRLRLDMFTTANMLTGTGQTEMRELYPTVTPEVSPHDVTWERVPLQDLPKLAAAAYRAAMRTGNQKANRSQLVSINHWRPRLGASKAAIA